MFSLFKKSTLPDIVDKVWKTREACLKGLATEALNLIKNKEAPVVLFFFQEAGKKFAEFLEAKGLPYARPEETPGSSDLALHPIWIVDAFTIGSHEVNAWLAQRSKTAKLSFLFLGHYPLPAMEEQVAEKLTAFPAKSPWTFFLSLEDPLLEKFGSERIKGLMETMGMGDDEHIQHSMVSKAVLNARIKLGTQVQYEMKTKSEKDWFTKNITS